MIDADITLRPAQPADCAATYAWASDPDTRQASFMSGPIDIEEHERWFDRTMRGDRQLFIAELSGRAIGVLRFEPIPALPGSAEVSITVAPEERGNGIAQRILEVGNSTSRSLGYTTLIARIRVDNPRSIQTFERAGYSAERDETVHGVPARRYVLRLDDD